MNLFSDERHRGRDITLPDCQNKRPPHWNSSSRFDFEHIAVISMHQSAKFHRNRTIIGGVMTLYRFSRWPALRRNFTSGFGLGEHVFSECQSLTANQISSEYLNPRLRYNYFRFGETNSTSDYNFDYITVIDVILHQAVKFHPIRTIL